MSNIELTRKEVKKWIDEIRENSYSSDFQAQQLTNLLLDAGLLSDPTSKPCDNCGEDFEVPKIVAKKYCDGLCKEAASARRKGFSTTLYNGDVYVTDTREYVRPMFEGSMEKIIRKRKERMLSGMLRNFDLKMYEGRESELASEMMDRYKVSVRPLEGEEIEPD